MSAQAQPQLGKLCSVFRLYKNNLAQNFYKRWRTFVTAREHEIAVVVGILAPPDFNNPIFLGPTRFLFDPRHGKSDIRSWGLWGSLETRAPIRTANGTECQSDYPCRTRKQKQLWNSGGSRLWLMVIFPTCKWSLFFPRCFYPQR